TARIARARRDLPDRKPATGPPRRRRGSPRRTGCRDSTRDSRLSILPDPPDDAPLDDRRRRKADQLPSREGRVAGQRLEGGGGPPPAPPAEGRGWGGRGTPAQGPPGGGGSLPPPGRRGGGRGGGGRAAPAAPGGRGRRRRRSPGQRPRTGP